MNGKRALILSLSVLFLGHLVYFYPQLPEKMATHFNHLGEPNGWMAKNYFFIFTVGLMILLVGMFFAISYVVPKFPDSLINLPNKDYWLVPERRAETFRRLQGHLEIFTIPILLLLIGINHLTFRANLFRENLSSAAWVLLGGFLVYTLFWSIGFYRKFKVYEN